MDLTDFNFGRGRGLIYLALLWVVYEFFASTLFISGWGKHFSFFWRVLIYFWEVEGGMNLFLDLL